MRIRSGCHRRSDADLSDFAAKRLDGVLLIAMARRLLTHDTMSFAAVVDRVRGEFVEMPGLELTLPQAVRLWSLGADDCRFVIDALVDVGFLKWTTRRTIVRTGRDLAVGPDHHTANISVGRRFRGNKSV